MENGGHIGSANSLAMARMEKGKYNVESGYKSKSSRKWILIIAVTFIIVVLLISVIVLAILYEDRDSNSSKTSPQKSLKPSDEPSLTPTTTQQICETRKDVPTPSPPSNPEGPYMKAAVSADDVRCSKIGVDVLKMNGSAVDAAIAGLFCIGVIQMHSAGIGGGAVMVVYTKAKKTAEYFNFREKAPRKASKNMFKEKNKSSLEGGLAIAVPGEIKGMYEAHKKYGKLRWRELILPSINLAREGFIIHEALHQAIDRKIKIIKEREGLREILVKDNGCVKTKGDRIINEKLAITLERISFDPESFYNGNLAEDIARDVQKNNGIITQKDLADYNVEIEPAVTAQIGDLNLYTSGLPSSGVLIAFMLNVLKGYNFTSKDIANNKAKASTYHKMIETFRYAFARRALLGDKNYANVTQIYADLQEPTYAENIRQLITNRTYHNASHYGGYFANHDVPGTSHLSVLASNGDAVSVTSTINTHFGSKVRSTVTGIIYNNEMDDFSTPGLINTFGVRPSPSNFIKPGKRPMSSMSPIILTNKTSGDVVFVAGASGGTRITTATLLVIMRKIWFGLTTSEAVNMPRFHDQLFPDFVTIEKPPRNLDDDIVDKLRTYGHKVKAKRVLSVVQAISKEINGLIYAKSDPRKGGYSLGY